MVDATDLENWASAEKSVECKLSNSGKPNSSLWCADLSETLSRHGNPEPSQAVAVDCLQMTQGWKVQRPDGSYPNVHDEGKGRVQFSKPGGWCKPPHGSSESCGRMKIRWPLRSWGFKSLRPHQLKKTTLDYTVVIRGIRNFSDWCSLPSWVWHLPRSPTALDRSYHRREAHYCSFSTSIMPHRPWLSRGPCWAG